MPLSRTLFSALTFLLLSLQATAQIRLSTPQVESLLYLGTGKQQALVVGLGGSEGGNAWASDYWKKTREQFLEKGYAFLAIGYFGAEGTPDTLNRIAIDAVYRAIQTASRHPQVDSRKIALIGGSRGADLALLLGSYYKSIDCVVGLMASQAVFPGHTSHFSTPCWTYRGRDLPFVPVNEAAIPFLMRSDLRGAFEAMLQDSAALAQAVIPVENIRGPVLLLSATEDEICPSTPMAAQMVERLRQQHFRYPYEHLAFPGGHAAPLQHLDRVFAFLDLHFRE